MNIDDLVRLRMEYADRERRLAGSDIYSLFNPATLFIWQSRERAILSALRRYGYEPLGNRRILEVGCGNGGVLLEFLHYGATPQRLHGVELLSSRAIDAHRLLPHVALVNADGQYLPYEADYFDIVMQYTVFTSILDDSIKRNLAHEMLRVLHKSRGIILWYDFWLNPTNPQTRGIRASEIRQLFPHCYFKYRRITLAPPIVRRLFNISHLFCQVLEGLLVFNTHYLVVIRPIS